MTPLQKLLKEESKDFYRVDYRWQPKDLLPAPQSKRLLDDVGNRVDLLEDCFDDFKGLPRGARYTKIIKRMQLGIRRARFAWKHDDLVFIQAVSELFQDYGTILQMLKTDDARGMLSTP